MKRTLLSGCLSFIVGCLIGIFIVVIGKYPTHKQEHAYKINEVKSAQRIIKIQQIENEEETDQLEMISQSMQQELAEIESIRDREKWFLAYKDIIYKYYKWFGAPETVFDAYTEEELMLIFRTVETECYDADFLSKCNVASVIFNRIESGDFGESVEEVITSPNQFAYWRENVTESTILSVMYVYEIGDTTDGCVAFRSDQRPTKWYGWQYVFTDEVGHNFYK